MVVLKEYTFINATTVALNQLIFERRSNMTCQAMFPEKYARAICLDEAIRPTYYEGVLVWVIAYYYRHQYSDVTKLDAHRMIRIKLGMGSSVNDLDDLIKNSKLKDYFDEIEDDFKEMFGCQSKPCDKQLLSRLQFAGSVVTSPKSSKYTDLKFDSVAKIPGNRKFLQNKIPEISGFYRIHFNHTGRIFGGDIQSLLGYNKGIIYLTRRLTS